MGIHQPVVDPDDTPVDEQTAADNLDDQVGPDDFDVFDVLGLGKAGATGNEDNAAGAETGADNEADDSASSDGTDDGRADAL